MGKVVTANTYRKAETEQELLTRFATLMRERHGAELFLFGSRARGTARADSDYDLVAVAESFQGRRAIERASDRILLWFEAGGMGLGLDLHCYTPTEFAREKASGLGYLAAATRHGELVPLE